MGATKQPTTGRGQQRSSSTANSFIREEQKLQPMSRASSTSYRDESEESDRNTSAFFKGMRHSKLPAEFAGRVLKLEMQIEKGPGHATMDDINNLMDLYT